MQNINVEILRKSHLGVFLIPFFFQPKKYVDARLCEHPLL